MLDLNFMGFEIIYDRYGLCYATGFETFKDAEAFKNLWNEFRFKDTRKIASVELDFDTHKYKVNLRDSYV